MRNSECGMKERDGFYRDKGDERDKFSVYCVLSMVKKMFPAKSQRCKERQKNFFRDLSRVSWEKNIPQRLKGVKNDRRTDN